ncbi:MAG TPA: DsbA family protein, partial [Terriglobia bacterium]|nr:DsbA family protein [Terriglobia bacterium]
FRMFAESLKLDLDRFTSCLRSGKYKPLVKADFDEGIRLGATGTPAFFINGIFINGARPQPEFEEVIEALLASLE